MTTAIQPSFDDLSTPLIDVAFCVLDLETTGGSAATCEITEIAGVRYLGGDLIGSYQTLVDPGALIPPSITILTGITQSMVFDAPRIETALPSFLEFIGDAIIVGHNIRFDMSFLNAACIRLGYPRIGNQTVDTAALARRLVRPDVRNLKLATLASHFRSPVTPNHRALEDARATAHVFHSLLERAGSIGVTNLDDLIQLPRAKGSAHYSKIRLTEPLPRAPGVYVFKDRHDVPIYVGKASNLRARVRQYFYGDKRRSVASMMRELEAIEYRPTNTLLEAEVTEIRLIHAYRPRYNRRSRPPKTSHFVKLTKEKYPRLSVVRTLRDDALIHLGPFRSKRTADLVVTALWDSTPIRRCHARPGSRSGKCAAAQLGVSLCPCDGLLDEDIYRKVVLRLIDGVTVDPSLLLEPLVVRMEEFSDNLRFEEAGWVRDRHDALARAIELRQSWSALQGLGCWEGETLSGDHASIDHGRLVATWTTGQIPSFVPVSQVEATISDVAPSVQIAEEADLIWRWLVNNEPRLIEASGELAVPARQVRRLRPGSRI